MKELDGAREQKWEVHGAMGKDHEALRRADGRWEGTGSPTAKYLYASRVTSG